MAQDGLGPHPAPQSCVPQADTGLAVSPVPPVAKERLWLSALALGDVPTRCPRSRLSVGQSQAVHQWGWFAPAAQTSSKAEKLLGEVSQLPPSTTRVVPVT